MSELIALLAATLEAHQKTLITSDENSMLENAAYDSLAKDFRSIAAELEVTAKRMEGFRDLPMGKHDEKILNDPKTYEPFRAFVAREEELLKLLRQSLEREQQMLAQMRA